MISKSNQPLQQLCKRVIERKYIMYKPKILSESFNDKFIVEGTDSEYSQITLEQYKLSNTLKDSCVLLNDSKIIIC